jgi:hypothetical protein
MFLDPLFVRHGIRILAVALALGGGIRAPGPT